MKKRYSIPQWTLIGLAVALLGLHLTLPYLIRNVLNDKLAEMGDYRGHIDDIDLAWWRGAYRIEGLVIVKDQGKVPVPFVEAPGIDLAVSWHSLWHDQAIVGRVTLERPELNFVDGRTEQQSQTGTGVDWRARLETLLPITLDEVRVQDGRVAFHNFQSTPPVNLQANAVNASVYNLTNVTDKQAERVARFEGTALLFGHAPLESSATFDPLRDFDDFALKLRVTDIQLPQLNDFAAAYGKFDFKSGSGDLVMEASADNGQLSGYIKPLLRKVEIFDWQQDVANREKGFFRSIWEAMLGGSETLLKNQHKDQFATRVALSGNVHQRDISAFQAFLAILRNAFIEAFNTRFESMANESKPVAE